MITRPLNRAFDLHLFPKVFSQGRRGILPSAWRQQRVSNSQTALLPLAMLLVKLMLACYIRMHRGSGYR